MSEHNECVVKLSNGKLDWYDPVWNVHVKEDGSLFIETALYNYTIPAEDWFDYKVRPYNEDTTFSWED